MSLLIGGFLEGLRPEPNWTVTEYAEKHVKLGSKGSAEPGPYRVSRTPYMREPQDAMSSRTGINKVVMMKASQVAGTTAGFNVIAYYMDCVPCPIMYVMPTAETMERNVKQRIDPLIEDNESLKAKIGKKRSKDGGNTLQQKDFPGGTLILTGANSAAGLRSIAVRVAIVDEVDAYKDDVDNEGSPLSLIERRQATFGDNKKTFIPSTPTIEGASRIETEFLLTDQNYYWVPCPFCFEKNGLLSGAQDDNRGGLTPRSPLRGRGDDGTGEVLRGAQDDKRGAQDDKRGAQDDKRGAQDDKIKWERVVKKYGLQQLVFEQLRWNKKDYRNVYYECVHCGGHIENRHKTWMLRDEPLGGTARWIPAAPGNCERTVKGYHINALYSPEGWYSWNQIAKDWDECENDEPKRKAFWNTVLAKTYKVKGDAPPWQMLFERAQNEGLEANVLQSGVALITAGVDVQADRLEIDIVGWSKGRISQQIDYRVIMGDTTKEEVWEQLAEVLEERWFLRGAQDDNVVLRDAQDDKRGAQDDKWMEIRMMAVDTGFSTSKVYDFCKKYGPRRVIPVKGGHDGEVRLPFKAPKHVNKTALGKNTGKLKVFVLGVGYLKEQLYGWLRLPIPVEGEMAGLVPNGYCRLLPRNSEYFRGLTAEELTPVANAKTNFLKFEWITRYARNEPLDCRVYAMGAAYVVGFDKWKDDKWDKLAIRSSGNGAMPLGLTPRSPLQKRGDDQVGKSGPEVLRGAQDDKKRGVGGKKVRRSKGGFWS